MEESERIVTPFEEVDWSRLATKDDLDRFATKDDLKRFATKEDLERFATRDDLDRFATEAEADRQAIRNDVREVRHDLTRLELQLRAEWRKDLLTHFTGQTFALAAAVAAVVALG